MSGPVIRLQSLSPEELLILLANIRSVFAMGDTAHHLVPDEALAAFMAHCNQRIGEAYFRTPRNTIKAFVQLLSILEQIHRPDGPKSFDRFPWKKTNRNSSKAMLTTMNSPRLPSNPEEAFSLLHPAVQRWVREQGWSNLREVQQKAVLHLAGSNRDLLISATTAAGKTEAAFLALLGNPPAGSRRAFRSYTSLRSRLSLTTNISD